MRDLRNKITNASIYLSLFILGGLAGFAFFDSILMPAIIGSGKAFPIPNVVGLTAEDGKHLAEENGFRFKIVRDEFSTTILPNRIMSQIPKAGSFAKKGRTIRVVISKGIMQTIVPNVVGLQLRQAQMDIEAAKLLVDSIEQQYNDTIEAGRILAISPEVGETVAIGTRVVLIVSGGRESAMIAVPNLVGMNYSDACKILSSLGLRCMVVMRKIPTISSGEVFKQEPAPGTMLYRGNGVSIMVNEPEKE